MSAIKTPLELKNKRKSLKRSEYRFGYLMILPMLIGFLIFVLVPIIATIMLSFYDFDLLRGTRYVGINNYIKMFANDPTFTKSAVNTLYFTILLVPLNMFLCLGLALLLEQKIRGIGIFRTIIFTPYVTSAVSWALVWKFMLQTDSGVINIVLRIFGSTGPNWLYTESLAIPVVVLVTLLKGFGMNTIIFISALKEVPDMYYEAASLDGAGAWKRFTSLFIKPDQQTAYASILTTYEGENRVTVFSGANLTTGDVEKMEHWFSDSQMLLLTAEIPEDIFVTAMEFSRKYNIKTIINPAPFTPWLKDHLQDAWCLTPNTREARCF